MGDWPLFGSLAQMQWLNTNSGQTYPPALTAGAANTKGSYGQWCASTPYEAAMLMLVAQVMANADVLLDIAIGAVGSEQIILNNLLISNGTSSSTPPAPTPLLIPISIPAGVRLSARIQSSKASATVNITCHILSQDFLSPAPLSQIITYGANTGTSGGISIDPGATANTKGSWIQIISSSDRLARMFLAFGNQVQSARVNSLWSVDIGVGAAGSEKVIIADFPLYVGGVYLSAILPIHSPIFPVTIPSGTRLSARAACYINTATKRNFDLVIYGVN